ncbi:SCAN domain-containing protein 3 [Manis javanica]|nr:SCAN domain-containing protein 3 [Manis javanica]
MIWWLFVGSDFQQQHLCHQLREIPYPDARHSEPPGSSCQLHLQLLDAQTPTGLAIVRITCIAHTVLPLLLEAAHCCPEVFTTCKEVADAPQICAEDQNTFLRKGMLPNVVVVVKIKPNDNNRSDSEEMKTKSVHAGCSQKYDPSCTGFSL